VSGRYAFVGWFLATVAAGSMGLLLIEDEPGATVGRQYLAAATGFGAIALATRRLRRANAGILIVGASFAMVLLTAIHVVLVPFAYSGLSNIILVLVVVAAAITLLAVRRGELPVVA
jgi:hypothetical protein